MVYHKLICSGLIAGLTVLGGCSGKTDQATGNTTTSAMSTTTTTTSTAVARRMPKPGLWEMTVSAMGMPEAMKLRTCIAAPAPGANPFTPPAQPGQKCAKNSVEPTATGYAIDMECSANGMTTAIQGSVSGDFSTSFRTDLMTKMTGADMPPEARAGVKSSVDARYVGACPADMKPGEARRG